MNRSFRAEEECGPRQRQPLMGSIRSSDEELSLFLEMRRREKDKNNPNEFDPLGSKTATVSAASVHKTRVDEFLNADNDKTDYDWLLTPPGTPLFPSLEMESQKTMMSQLGTSKAHPTSLRSRFMDPLSEATGRSKLSSRQLAASSPGLDTSSSSLRRPSSFSGGSRPLTPTGGPTLRSSNSTLTSASSRPTSTKTMSNTTLCRSSRSSTPTSCATLKPTFPPRSSTPTARSTARSSTPTSRAPPITGSKSTSRAATPTRRQINTTVPPVKPSSSSSRGTKSGPRNPGEASQATSPTIKPRSWKPSDMPGFSLDTPPNLRTSLADRPVSATRGRSGGASSVRSSSVEPASNGRIRRQSCSPSRGRPPNGVVMHSSGSSVPVPSMSRLHAKAKDNVSPVMVGTKMVERVINMRRLVPPKQDDRHSPHSNLSVKSSSPDSSSGFGRSLSKKSLDMAIRHMDLRQRIPGNLRPLMTNIPASSMYSVRSGPNRSRMNVPDSPLATSSNTSSEVSISNNAMFVDDDISSDKGVVSPATVRGR